METHKPRFASFALGLVMGLLLVSFQKLQIQPLSWLPEGLIKKVQAIAAPEAAEQVPAIQRVAARLTSTENIYAITRATSNQTADASLLDITAPAYLTLDFDTGEVIAEKNASERVAIASLTKVMTAMVVLDLASPDEYFTVSEKAASEIPTRIGVVPNQRMKVSELLEALLLTSANDAATVLQEGIDRKYGESVFIRAMNMKAKNIGLHNTSFDNPQGFDGRHNYSTAEDLAILSQFALTKYPFIQETVQKDYEFLPDDKNHKQFDLYNWNGLIGVYPNTQGLKIGNTGRAGKTTIVIAERDGRKVLVILLGAPTVLDRDMWAAKLLDYSFAEAYGLVPIAIGEDALLAKYATWM